MGSARINIIRQRLALTTKISKILDSKGNEIPGGYPFYVTSRDTYLSGLGPASGMNNRLVFPAKTIEEVEALKLNMGNRGDQDQIKVHNKIPKLDFERDYVQSKGLGTEFSYSKWYEGDAFDVSPKVDPKEAPMKDLAKVFDMTGDPETAGMMRDTMRKPPKPTRQETRDIHEARLKIGRIRKNEKTVDATIDDIIKDIKDPALKEDAVKRLNKKPTGPKNYSPSLKDKIRRELGE